jgi:hypothetical protein
MNLLHLFRLIAAMIQVESGGNECAYNRSEQAAGCLQIRPIMVAEAERLGIDFTLADRWDCAKSVRFFIELQMTKKRTSFEEMARCWNGGPKGNSLNSTLNYWQGVQTAMKKQ